jgi:ATP/maltotriose-dependent transcriptional regulator MalT
VGQAEPGLRATALGLETWSATVAGALRRARAGHARALPAFAELPDAEIVNWLDGVGLLASGCMFLERYRDALEIAARGLAAVDAHGAPPGAPLVMLRLVPAAAHLFLGHLERSATLHDEAIDTARLTRDRQGLMWALSWRGRVAHAAGDTDAALSLGKESIAIADELGTVGLSAWIAGNFAAVLAGAGQHRLARDVLLSRCGGPELPLAGAVERPRLFATLADAALALDGPDAALPWVERAEEEARELALPVGACHAARVRAGLLAAHGNHAEAAEVALAPVAGAEEAGSLVDAAYMRVIAGRALGASGDRAGAIELLEGAEAALERYRAGRLAKIAARELRRLGRGRRQRSRAALDSGGVESLSDRELEVAELVRARRTNVQIAAELFLSRKTIDTHMTNIFRKLGASSRVEVAERLEQVAASR